jgi:predicted nucleic-acid-binding protein
MEELIKKVLAKNKTYFKEQIELRPYCLSKMNERRIDEETVISTLLSDNLFYVEIQKRPFKDAIEDRYKLIYKLSSRYSLIIVVAYHEKVLKVINVIKTSKDMEKKWRKKILG